MKTYVIHFKGSNDKDFAQLAAYTTKQEALDHVKQHHKDRVAALEGLSDDGMTIYRFGKTAHVHISTIEGTEYDENHEYIETIVVCWRVATITRSFSMTSDDRYEIDTVKTVKRKKDEHK